MKGMEGSENMAAIELNCLMKRKTFPLLLGPPAPAHLEMEETSPEENAVCQEFFTVLHPTVF